MLTLYPAIKTYATHRVDVGDGHNLYVEESGKPDGIPVLFIHGGPGAGTFVTQRRYLDPDQYRIILFDQRGCGHSTPHASLENNTTQDLIRDIEKIREYLNIDRWVLFGGSWGSTLALLYAQEYPSRVLSFILRNVFLARRADVKWLDHGLKKVFPDYWQDFVKLIPDAEQEHIIDAYYKRLVGDDDVLRMAAAKSYVAFESKCATLNPSPRYVEQSQDPFFAKALARISCHYFMNNYFIEDNLILNNIHKINHIPAIIVHGRYDIICPIENAWDLHKEWPLSELYIIRNAGHAANEPAMIDGIVLAGREMSKLIQE